MRYLYATILLLLLLIGCAQDIESIKSEEMIGEQVTVSGTVTETVKIGPLSGYVLKDETGNIGVSSESLPAEGEETRVTGTLIRDTIFGYYIKAKE